VGVGVAYCETFIGAAGPGQKRQLSLSTVRTKSVICVGGRGGGVGRWTGASRGAKDSAVLGSCISCHLLYILFQKLLVTVTVQNNLIIF
jgi:hypothetical protein